MVEPPTNLAGLGLLDCACARAWARAMARDRAVEMMRLVGIPAAERRLGDYPHQFSGGMRQRIMIAMMIALKPAVLIADEPTTALDVTVQAQIMDLLKELQRETGTGLILITHDLGVIAQVCDEVAVMYAGRIVEQGPRAALQADDGRFARLLGDAGLAP